MYVVVMKNNTLEVCRSHSIRKNDPQEHISFCINSTISHSTVHLTKQEMQDLALYFYDLVKNHDLMTFLNKRSKDNINGER